MIDKIIRTIIFFLLKVLTRRNRRFTARVQPMTEQERKGWDALHKHWNKD